MKIEIEKEIKKLEILELNEFDMEVIKHRSKFLKPDPLRKFIQSYIYDKIIDESKLTRKELHKVNITSRELEMIVRQVITCCEEHRHDLMASRCPICGNKL